MDQSVEELSQLIGNKAENLFRSKQMLCTEAVMSALNQGLGGGISPGQAGAMASGFTEGLGGSGCLCGAVSGAIMALGLFLAKGANITARRRGQKAAATLHDDFKKANRSTCCRVLSKPVKNDDAAHFDQCARLSGQAAEMAAKLILAERPDLAAGADLKYLGGRDGALRGRMKSLFRKVG